MHTAMNGFNEPFRDGAGAALGMGGAVFIVTAIGGAVGYAITRSRVKALWTWTVFVLLAMIILGIGGAQGLRKRHEESLLQSSQHADGTGNVSRQEHTPVQPDDARSEIGAPAPAKQVLVKVSQIRSDAPVLLDRMSASDLKDLATDTVKEITRSLAASMIDAREATKLEHATGESSFGTAGGVRVAIVRIRLGTTRPIAVIMGPSPKGLAEIYCSNQKGDELLLRDNECAEAIRRNFGGDVEEQN